MSSTHKRTRSSLRTIGSGLLAVAFALSVGCGDSGEVALENGSDTNSSQNQQSNDFAGSN